MDASERRRRSSLLLLGAVCVAALLGAVYYALLVRAGAGALVALAALPVLAVALTRPRVGLYLGLVLILVLPTWQTVGSAQVDVLRIAAICALVAILRNRSPRPTWLDAALIGYVLWRVAAGVLWGAQPGVNHQLIVELTPVAFYVAARGIGAEHVRTALTVVFAAGAFGALTVLLEAALGSTLVSHPGDYYWVQTTDYIFRPGGVYGSPPGAATVLAMTSLCGLPLVRAARGQVRSALLVAVAVQWIAVIATFTRAGLIALFVAVLLYLWSSRTTWLSPVVVGSASVVATIAFVLVVPTLEHTATFQKGLVRPGTFATRTSLWQFAVPVATASSTTMVIGIGSEASLLARTSGVRTPALAAAPDLITYGTHNQYVFSLMENGLVGLVTLLLWLGVAIGSAVRSARRRADAEVAALGAALVVFAIVCAADNAVLHSTSFAIACVCTGCLVSARAYERDAKQIKVP